MCGIHAANIPKLKFQLLRLLPGEDVSAKVAVGTRLLENWSPQLQIFDDSAWPEVKVLLDDVSQLCGCFGGGSEAEHGDGQGLGNADGVRHLDQAAAAQTHLAA